MNNIFCLKRFLLLLRLQWSENKRVYILGILATTLILGIFFWLPNSWTPTDRIVRFNRDIVYPLGLIVSSVYFAFFFNSMNKKERGMFYFSLPVSTFERVTVVFVHTMIFAPVVLFAILNVIDFFSVKIFNNIHGTYETMYYKTFSIIALRSLFAKYLGFMSLYLFLMLIRFRYGKIGESINFLIIVLVFFSFRWTKVPFWDMLHVFAFLLPVCWMLIYFTMKLRET